MTTDEFILTRGPSREQLFDSLRLGTSIAGARFVEFMGEHRSRQGKGASALLIEIEGVHRASTTGFQWFFWGKCKNALTRSCDGSLHNPERNGHCFGMWNTHKRFGVLRLKDSSFFVCPEGIQNVNDGIECIEVAGGSISIDDAL